MEGYKDKHYGLVGQIVEARWRNGTHPAYPWKGMKVPVEITAEYPKFLCGTVLPHRSRIGLGISRPYPITICKHDVYLGHMEIRRITI